MELCVKFEKFVISELQITQKSLIYKKNIHFILVFCSYPSAQNDPKITEVWTPVSKVITPAVNRSAPANAIVFFEGNLNGWTNEKGGTAGLIVENGCMTVNHHL
ncbi:MAG: hypothetical protein U0W24_24150 [Bacteroidales bacterium]